MNGTQAVQLEMLAVESTEANALSEDWAYGVLTESYGTLCRLATTEFDTLDEREESQ